MNYTHLEESLQPPHLEDTLPNNHRQLEDTPPLDPAVRALRRIPVHALTHNNVPLLIPDLCKGIGESAD